VWHSRPRLCTFALASGGGTNSLVAKGAISPNVCHHQRPNVCHSEALVANLG
jgi:hypothetical protein